MTTRPSDIKRKVGTMNVSGTKKWNGTKWVPVNVARDGQKATRNGKPVIRKNGKWVPYTPPKRGYNPVQRSTPTTTKPTPTKPTNTKAPKNTYTVSGVTYDRNSGASVSSVNSDGSTNRAKYGYSIDPKTGKRTNNRPPSETKPESTTKVTPTKPTTTKPTTTKPTPTKPARKPQQQGEGGMDANYKAWAKANPTLAKKVKKGQAGYRAINSTSTKTKPAAGTGNHRGAGNGAPGAQRSSLKTTPTKPTPTKTKPTPTKPTPTKTKQKPLTVPDSQIPRNLNSPAGRKYIADLDAGKLTRRRK